MKLTKSILAAMVSASLAFGVTAQAGGKKHHHEEESIDSSSVPSAVQQAAEKEASGGKIVRWEKEGANYEAEIEKDGKTWGYKFDAKGKYLSKHDEGSEHSEKSEKSDKY
jgi:hypothetical protein